MEPLPDVDDAASELVFRLESPVPLTLPRGSSSVLFLMGHCWHRHLAVTSMEVSSGGPMRQVDVTGMPRPDVGTASDPQAPGAWRSGFWTTMPLDAPDSVGRAEITFTATLEDGTRCEAPPIPVEFVDPPTPVTIPTTPVAICMATYEPDPALFAVQIESIRDQTFTDWVCLISDDGSSPESLAMIQETVGDDERFVVSQSPGRLGFYRNFERSLGMVSGDFEQVVLCDQDDRWYPDKIESLRSAIGSACLVYSDQRLTDVQGGVIAETLWIGRRNNHTNLASMIVANTVTGAASMFRRDLLDQLLPFPDVPGWEFHDQWIAITALANGDVAYVDRPLYDYVQHSGAILGQVSGEFASEKPGLLSRIKERVRPWKAVSTGWRAAYFFDVLRVQTQAETVLARASAGMPAGKKRVLGRFSKADHSLFVLFWLLLRPARSLLGRTETLGTESELARGLLWRRLTSMRARRASNPADPGPDASLPPGGPANYGSGRLKRWRAG